MIRPLCRALRAALVLAVAALPTATQANMADPFRPGDPVGEPSAALAGLRVLHERLTFDLRPLAADGPAVVEAVYVLENRGPARSVPLVFVARALRRAGAGVWLDGRPLAVARDDSAAVAYEDALAGGAGPSPRAFWAEAGDAAAVGGLRFDVTLTPGRHEVRVRYLAEPSADDGDGAMRAWTVGYALAPARRWDGFGRLDLTIEVPEGWAAAPSLPLAREGDRLAGTFEGVPADAFVVTVEAPAPGHIWPLRLLAAVLWLGLCWGAGRATGVWLGRRGRSAWWAVGPSVVAAGTAAVAAAVLVAVSYQAGDSYGYGYGGVFVGGFLVAPLAFAVGLAVAQAAAVRARRRATAGADFPQPE